MTEESEVEIVDQYAHLTQVLADAGDAGDTIRHSDEPPVAIVRAEAEASLWAIVVGDVVSPLVLKAIETRSCSLLPGATATRGDPVVVEVVARA